jgi:hypothetical protein
MTVQPTEIYALLIGLVGGGGLCATKQAAKRAAKRIAQRTPPGPTIMYDSIDPQQFRGLPTDAALAGYIDGRREWQSYHALPQLYPHHPRLSITVAGALEADAADGETGDLSIAGQVNWVKQKLADKNVRPWVYRSVATMPALLAALERAGVPRTRVRLWTAHYTGIPHLCSSRCWPELRTTADATQWTDHALGRNLDQSVIQKGAWKR